MSASQVVPSSQQAFDSEPAQEIKVITAPVPGGLVPADQLPSAADVMAQLFPPEENGSDRKHDTLSVRVSSDAPSFSYDSALPPFDLDSLSEETKAEAMESSSGEIPSWLSETEETDPELRSLAIENEVPEITISHSVSALKETPENAQDVDFADGTAAVPRTDRRNRRSKGSFRRLATGIRKLLRGSSRAEQAGAKKDTSEAPGIEPPEIATAPESIQLAAASEENATENSVSVEEKSSNVVPGSASAIEETALGTPAGTFENLTADDASHRAKEADLNSSHDVQPTSFQLEVGETLEHHEPAKPDGHFFQEERSNGSSEPIESLEAEAIDPRAGDEVDATDDDHAIATAIERYANTTALAAEEAALLATLGMTQSEVAPESSEQEQNDTHRVDINTVLEIPRDPEPPRPEASNTGLLNTAISQPPAFASAEEMPPAPETQSTSAESTPIEDPAHVSAEDNVTSHVASIPYRDWSFEEKIASHHEWLESKSSSGKKADLAGADLEGSDLIGVDLRYVDLHDANLRAADLLMADLRDACLARANFRDSCLVGANLEAANLEGASLETAMGLVPRQLAGANLQQASLPASVLQFEALAEFKRTARQVQGYFVALMAMCTLSTLLIWMTKDYQLLTNSAVLFFLHSSTAAAALPTVQFYLIAPMALFAVYLVLQFHLHHLWDLALELPAVFPDGHSLGENEPRVVLGLLRAHFRWMNADAPSTRFVEKGASMLVVYWVVPVTLLLYWVRFMTLQQLRGTTLQAVLIAAATGVALYSSTKVGKPAEGWIEQGNVAERVAGKLRDVNPVTPALVLFGVLMYLAIGTITGVPHSKERAPQFMAGSPRRWAPTVLWSFGIDPYADITEAVISKKPANWNGSDDQVSSVNGAQLNGANFRYAQAYRAFLANAHLLHANLQGAFLSQADLRSAEMGQSNLKYAILDQAQMNHVNLDRATLTGANLSRADLRSANLSYASMGGTTLVDAHLDGATLYGAKLTQATLIRTNLEKADLRESHLEGANLEHVDMQGAYLWSAKLMGASLTNAELQKAILVDADLHGADLRWAHLDGTVLTGADLTGAYLDGADLRSAVGFGANQICAAKSRHGLLLDDAMQAQVAARCGAGN